MVLRRIELPGATDVVRFADNQIVVVAIECLEDCPVINTPLAQRRQLFPDLPSTVVGVVRDGQLFVPHSEDQLFAGDVAYVVATKDQVRRTLRLFGHEEQEATRIVVAGGGNIGLFVARTLEQRQSRTKGEDHRGEQASARSPSPTSCAGPLCCMAARSISGC